jgi:hypothetical protein
MKRKTLAQIERAVERQMANQDTTGSAVIEGIPGTEFHSEIGSWRGAIKKGGRWISVKDLNRVQKTGWVRYQGPPSPALEKAMNQPPVDAVVVVKAMGGRMLQ